MFGRKKKKDVETIDVRQLEKNLANARRLRQEMGVISTSFVNSTNNMLVASGKEIKRV